MPCSSHDELIEVSNRAETSIPKNLEKSEPPCLGCKDAKPDRSRQGSSYRKRWNKFRERGVSGIDTLEGGGLVSAPVAVKSLGAWGNRVIFSQPESKALNERQEALYEATEKLVEDHGKFDQGAGPDGAHYMPAAKNPFVKDGLVCSNCAYWVGPNGCEIVAGKLEPNAICKLWIIDGSRLKEEKSDQSFDEKALGPKINSRRRGTRVEPFDPDAEDGDEDGQVQDGTIHQRLATPSAPKVPESVADTSPAVNSSGSSAKKKKKQQQAAAGNQPKEKLKKTFSVGDYDWFHKGKMQHQINEITLAKPLSRRQAKAMQRRHRDAIAGIAFKYGVDAETTYEEARATLESLFPNLDTSDWGHGQHGGGGKRLTEWDKGILLGLIAAYEIHKDNKLFINSFKKMGTLLPPPWNPAEGADGQAGMRIMEEIYRMGIPGLQPRRIGRAQLRTIGTEVDFALERDFHGRAVGNTLPAGKNIANGNNQPKNRFMAFWRIHDRLGWELFPKGRDSYSDEERMLYGYMTAMHEMGHTAANIAAVKKASRKGERVGLPPIDENTDLLQWSTDYMKKIGRDDELVQEYFKDDVKSITNFLKANLPFMTGFEKTQFRQKLGLSQNLDLSDTAAVQKELFRVFGEQNNIIFYSPVFDDILHTTNRGLSDLMPDHELRALEKILISVSPYALQSQFKDFGAEGPAELMSYIAGGGEFTDQEWRVVGKYLDYLGIDISQFENLIKQGGVLRAKEKVPALIGGDDLGQLLGRLKNDEDGFSVSISDLSDVKTGWAISRKGQGVKIPLSMIYDEDGNPTQQGRDLLHAFVLMRRDQLLDEEIENGQIVLGAWNNKGFLYLDVTEVHDKDSMTVKEAIERGRQENQISIADLDNINLSLQDNQWESRENSHEAGGTGLDVTPLEELSEYIDIIKKGRGGPSETATQQNVESVDVIQNESDGILMQMANPITMLSGYHNVEKDWKEVRAVPLDEMKSIADFYDNAPDMAAEDIPEEARRAYEALVKEVEEQFRILTEELGISVEFTDEDPYQDFAEMYRDFVTNRRLKILKTEVTGGHPFFTDEQNDMFRAVHDAFGHLATGRGFDRHGEEAAYQAHKSMFGAEAAKAAATELRGQNSFLIARGFFGPQKLVLLPEMMRKWLSIFGVLIKAGSSPRASADIEGSRRWSDKDNAYDKTGSHHVSCGRVMKRA